MRSSEFRRAFDPRGSPGRLHVRDFQGRVVVASGVITAAMSGSSLWGLEGHVGLNALVEAAPRSANVVAGDKGAILYEVRFDAGKHS